MSKNKIYHLSHCTTCQGILSELNTQSCDLLDIKQEPITEKELDHMAKLAGGYEILFSRRAMKYQSMKLKDKVLTEQDYRKLILIEYTFLRRPVIIVGDKIFIGNAAKEVSKAKIALE